MRIEKVYEGRFDSLSESPVATLNGAPLPLGHEFIEYSDKFAWDSFTSKVPDQMQLAVALAVSAFPPLPRESMEIVIKAVYDYVVRRFEGSPWTLTDVGIREWLCNEKKIGKEALTIRNLLSENTAE